MNDESATHDSGVFPDKSSETGTMPGDRRSWYRPRIVSGRLRAAREVAGLNLRDLGDRLRVKPSRLSQWEKGATVPSMLEVLGMCQVMGKSPAWFYGEEQGDVIPVTDHNPSVVRDRVDALVNLIFVGAEARRVSLDSLLQLAPPASVPPGELPPNSEFIKLYDLAAAAGAGAEASDDDLVGHIQVDPRPFRARGVNPVNCDLVLVSGDSMHPFLQDGSMVMVDRGSNQLRDGRVFVIRGPEGLLVKRVRRDGDRWLLVSDNPEWGLTELDPGSSVVGEVRWVCNSV